MSVGDLSLLDSIGIYRSNYIDHFTDTNAFHIVTAVVPILVGISGYLNNPRYSAIIWTLLFSILGLTIVYVWWTGRPFGVEISCTPTHLVKGDRKPDKLSENRGNILIQNQSTKVHGEIQLAALNGNFDIIFEPSSEIGVELETKPRKEHSYDPDQNKLSCENVSDRRFPIKLDVFAKGEVETAGRYHSLTIKDGKTDHPLTKFDVIDVQS